MESANMPFWLNIDLKCIASWEGCKCVCVCACPSLHAAWKGKRDRLSALKQRSSKCCCPSLVVERNCRTLQNSFRCCSDLTRLSCFSGPSDRLLLPAWDGSAVQPERTPAQVQVHDTHTQFYCRFSTSSQDTDIL